MRLLHLTDTHLGAEGWYRGAPAGWTRADDHLAAMRQALEPALREEVDVVVHSGDLFDRSKPPRKAIDEAAALFEEVAARVPVLLMPGNHDRHGLRLHFSGGLRGVRIFDEPARVQLGELDVALVPYEREHAAWAAIATIAHGADLLFAHQSFDGCRVPGFTFRAGHHGETVAAHELPDVPWIACGHLHPRQTLRLGTSRIVFAGSTERTAFSERAQVKGAVHWRTTDRLEWRYADLPSRPMVVVDTDEDLDAVRPGALVRTRPEYDDAVLARGGWVPPRAKRELRQSRLFDGGRRPPG